MPRKSIFDMPFSAVYAALISKAEKKGRTKAEADEITCWLIRVVCKGLPVISYGPYDINMVQSRGLTPLS